MAYYDGNVEQNHETFLRNLDKSQPSVKLVAEILKESGHDVRLGKQTKAKTHSEWQKHADKGDLFVDKERVEVKGLSAVFVDRYTWPFDPKWIVCAQHAWDTAVKKPLAFVCLSKDRNYISIAFGYTSKSWYVEERKDRRYVNYFQDFYFCPMDDVIFDRIENISKILFKKNDPSLSEEQQRLSTFF